MSKKNVEKDIDDHHDLEKQEKMKTNIVVNILPQSCMRSMRFAHGPMLMLLFRLMNKLDIKAYKNILLYRSQLPCIHVYSFGSRSSDIRLKTYTRLLEFGLRPSYKRLKRYTPIFSMVLLRSSWNFEATSYTLWKIHAYWDPSLTPSHTRVNIKTIHGN